MRKRRIIKILLIIVSVLIAKVTIFGLWHFASIRELTANVLLPIAIHILGGLGTVFLAWWLIDEDIQSKAKKEEWETVLAKTFSDLRRDVWLAKNLKKGASSESVSRPSPVYGRYWTSGLDELRLKLPNHHSHLERELWSLIHQFDVCNKMLETGSIDRAVKQAPLLILRIKSLEPNLKKLTTNLKDLDIEEPNFKELFAIKEDEKGMVNFSCQPQAEMAYH